ncbi:MAG: aldo/keto reductase [Phycisphaeraceae bacterium]|nr:aldo/keto reductase [Phycisphaeraceae bacterium]
MEEPVNDAVGSLPLRPLGRTGILVSPLGLGTVKLGRNTGVKYPSPFQLPTDNQASLLLGAALRAGINLIDTAPAYGEAEARIGTLLQRSRDDWVIVTKAGEEFEAGQSRFDFSAAAIMVSVERSLARLRTDRIDVLLIHSDGHIENDPGLHECRGALERLRDVGKARAVGISTKTPRAGLAALEWADVVMVTLNPRAVDELPVIEAARERGVGVLVKKALISGHVAGAVTGPSIAAAPDPHGESIPTPTAEECLTYCVTVPGVSSVIVGTANPTHLSQNALAVTKAIASMGR